MDMLRIKPIAPRTVKKVPPVEPPTDSTVPAVKVSPGALDVPDAPQKNSTPGTAAAVPVEKLN